MNGFNLRGGVLSSLAFLTFFLLASYQDARSTDHSAVVTTLHGKVRIRLEPHGSVRARVFQGQTLQYEFILDRETQQKLLTHTIEKANVYLVGKHGEELVIDDLKTQKRFILSMFDRQRTYKSIPAARTQPIVIKGYSISLLQ